MWNTLYGVPPDLKHGMAVNLERLAKGLGVRLIRLAEIWILPAAVLVRLGYKLGAKYPDVE